MPTFQISKELRKSIIGKEVFEIGERYQNLKPIGDGSYGFVVSAIDTLAPLENQNVAIKKIGDVFCDTADAKRVLREIKLLKHFNRHENIINISDIITIPPNVTDFRDVYIITNLMESNMDRVISSSQDLSDRHFQYFLYQILRGLKYIHSANVLHRDLKPSNLLVNSNCDLTICDFGLARQIDSEQANEFTEYVVTRWYRAPEGNNPIHQLETIVSILGIPNAEELSFVKQPAARKAILSCPSNETQPFESHFPADTNPLALDLLRCLLTFNPEKRITVTEAIEHPYLLDLHGQMDEPMCNKPFSFEYESNIMNHSVLIEELQKIIYEDVLQFRCAGCIDIAGRGRCAKGRAIGEIEG